MDILNLVVPLVAYAIGLGLMYLIIQSAVIGALRRARREQFVEDYLPEKAKWLEEYQRQQLRQHADALGRTTPVN